MWWVRRFLPSLVPAFGDRPDERGKRRDVRDFHARTVDGLQRFAKIAQTERLDECACQLCGGRETVVSSRRRHQCLARYLVRAPLIAKQGSPSANLDSRPVGRDTEHVRPGSGKGDDTGATAQCRQMRDDDISFDRYQSSPHLTDERATHVRTGTVVVHTGEASGNATHR